MDEDKALGTLQATAIHSVALEIKLPCEFRKMHHHLSHRTKFRCAEGFSSIFILWKLFGLAPN